MKLQKMLAAAALLTILLTGSAAFAQPAWPDRPIRLVVPFPPGGSSDLLGRIVAIRMARELKANFIVENKPGATTQIGTEFVARAKPDGYTMLLSSDASFTVLPNLRKLSYTLDDFELVANISDYVGVMAVRNDLPVSTLKEFVEYAKKNPGKLSFGSAGQSSVGHLQGEVLSHELSLEFLHVPFKGSADAVNAAVAGEVDFVIDGAAIPMIQARRLKGLATFFPSRHPGAPQVPALSETGVKVNIVRAGKGIMLPKGTPRPIVDKVTAALRNVVADPAVQSELLKANSKVSWQDPTAFRARLVADREVNAKLLPAIGMKQ